MASKPRSEWSKAYAARMARAEAKGLDRQAARGHTKAEHVVRKAGGAKQLRIAGALESTVTGWLSGITRGLRNAARTIGSAIGITPAPAPTPARVEPVAPSRGFGRADQTGRSKPLPAPRRLTPQQQAAADKRALAKARDQARMQQNGGLSKSERAYVRKQANLACDKQHGRGCDADVRQQFIQRALDWAERAGVSAVRRRVANNKAALAQKRGEQASSRRRGTEYVGGGGAVLDFMRLDDGDDEAPDEGWYYYN